MASTEPKTSHPFVIPPLHVEPLEAALSDGRYIVVFKGKDKRLMVTRKMADLIALLQQGKSLEAVADALSSAYQRKLSADDVRLIVERQMVPKGLALRVDAGPARPAPRRRRQPVRQRLLAGTFRRLLLHSDVVRRICAPLTPLFDPASVAFSVVLVVATRWMLYADLDRTFYRQTVLQLTPSEYLASLVILISLIVFHEFGHATALLRGGLPPGHIGVQLYFYIPALYANVDESWRLRPGRRVVVDAGGIYFQCVAASLLYLLYLKTHYAPLLTTVLTSDTLALISVNPFLKFDGYWLLADGLAVPNLQRVSDKLLGQCWRSLLGRAEPDGGPLPTGRVRAALLVSYAVLKRVFWAWVLLMIFRGAPRLLVSSSRVISYLGGECLRGLKTSDPLLAFSSFIRLVLFSLLTLAICTLILRLVVRALKVAYTFIKRSFAAPELTRAAESVE